MNHSCGKLKLSDSSYLVIEALAAQMRRPFLMTDARDRIIFANASFLMTYSLSPDEIRGKTVHSLRSGIVDQIQSRVLTRSAADSDLSEIVIKNETAEGGVKVIQIVSWSIFDEEGKCLLKMGIEEDVTGLDEDKLEKVRDELRGDREQFIWKLGEESPAI